MAILRTAEIRRDPVTQMREASNAEIIFDFSEDLKRGDHFPAIDVFYDGENHWLSDGWYRIAAHEEAGVKEIQANVHNGTLRDATEFAMGCNGNHGRERDDGDIRKAIRTALEDEEWGKKSDAEIGRMVKISGTTVGKERKKLKEEKKNGKPKEEESKAESTPAFSDNGIEEKLDAGGDSDGELSGETSAALDGDAGGDQEVREVERGGKRYNMKTKNLGGKPRGRPKGKKKKPRAEKDDEGKVIPHDLTGVFGAIEIFDKMASLISQVQGLLKEAKESPAGSRFRIQPIQVDLSNARKAITASTPYAVCPGRGDEPCKRSCERCGGQSYLDKTQWAGLPKALKKQEVEA